MITYFLCKNSLWTAHTIRNFKWLIGFNSIYDKGQHNCYNILIYSEVKILLRYTFASASIEHAFKLLCRYIFRDNLIFNYIYASKISQRRLKIKIMSVVSLSQFVNFFDRSSTTKQTCQFIWQYIRINLYNTNVSMCQTSKLDRVMIAFSNKMDVTIFVVASMNFNKWDILQ